MERREQYRIEVMIKIIRKTSAILGEDSNKRYNSSREVFGMIVFEAKLFMMTSRIHLRYSARNSTLLLLFLYIRNHVDYQSVFAFAATSFEFQLSYPPKSLLDASGT